MLKNTTKNILNDIILKSSLFIGFATVSYAQTPSEVGVDEIPNSSDVIKGQADTLKNATGINSEKKVLMKKRIADLHKIQAKFLEDIASGEEKLDQDTSTLEDFSVLAKLRESKE